MEIMKDTRSVSPETLKQQPHSRRMEFEECLPLLVSPDTGLPLQVDNGLKFFTDGENDYALRGGLPILIPAKLQPFFFERLVVPFDYYQDPFLQYFLLATIKQSGEINAAPSEESAHRHFFRAADFFAECKGITLDVGCDDPELGASLFTESVSYVGLDPFCVRPKPFRIIGVGEFLPFKDESVDNVIFNTSLDHILDWRRAISEAKRVLKKGASLYICTFIWTAKAELITDSVHFHHFRDYEIFGALDGFEINKDGERRYESPKGDAHRHGLYLKATKK